VAASNCADNVSLRAASSDKSGLAALFLFSDKRFQDGFDDESFVPLLFFKFSGIDAAGQEHVSVRN